jgi:MFS family permease
VDGSCSARASRRCIESRFRPSTRDSGGVRSPSSEPDSARPHSSLAPLRDAQFRRVWIASIVDQTGNWLQIAGRAWLIYHVTGSTTSLGTIYFLSYLPQLLLSQVGGVFADRYDRRKLLMVGGLLMGLGAVAMAIVAATGTATVLNVGLISVVVGVVQTLTLPAQVALVPALVPKEELSAAISLTAGTQATTRVIGPLLAGSLIPMIGAAWLFWINAFSFVVIVGVWWTTSVTPSPKPAERGIIAATVVAARWVRRTPAVAVVILTTFVVAGIGQVYQPLSVAFATKVLAHGDDSTGASYYGFFQAAIGVGSAIGIVGMTMLARTRPRRTFVVATLGCSAALCLLGITHVLGLALLVAAVIGACQFALTTLSLTIVQHMAPEEMRGRVLSIHSLAFVGPLPIIGLVGGRLASSIGLPATLLSFGVVCAVYCLPFLRMSRLLPTEPLEATDSERMEALAAAEEESNLFVTPGRHN